jgi:hypothetical protein
MILNDRIVKCLRLALDDGASEGEAQAAACRAITLMRKAGITVESLVQSTIYRYRMPPDSMRLPFGKYRGESLSYVVAHDPRYLRWLLSNASSLDRLFVSCATELLDPS